MAEFLLVVNLASVLGTAFFGFVVGLVYGWRIARRDDLLWLWMVVGSFLVLRSVYNLIVAQVSVGRSAGGIVLWTVTVLAISFGNAARRRWVRRKAEREVRNDGQRNGLPG